VLSAPMPLKTGERLVVRVPIAQNSDPQHRIGVLEHIRPGNAPEPGREAVRNADFEGRRKLGQGLHYNREQLTRTGEETLGDFLRSVPGLNLSDPNTMSTARMSRDGGMPMLSVRNGAVSSCHVGWFIDGHRIDLPGRSDPLTDGLGSMRMETIDAIEVFRGLSEMPVQFADPDLRCGAIAVWMRRG
jgi:TonB-dependent receptor-like protein